MSTLNRIFEKVNILLYHNETLDLDHYYQEPYQDEDDEIQEIGEPFETDLSRKKRRLDLSEEDRTYSGFPFYVDGSRRTYKIGDMVLSGKKYTRLWLHRFVLDVQSEIEKKLHMHGQICAKNLLLLSDRMNDQDFIEMRQRILKTKTAVKLNLDIVKYYSDALKDAVPVNVANIQ